MEDYQFMSEKKPTDNYLFSEFPTVSAEEWKNKIIKDLKGRDFEELQWAWSDDLVFEPYYTQEDVPILENKMPPTLRKNNDWEIGEDILWNDDLKRSHSILMEALMGGVNAPCIHIQKNMDVEDWNILLKDVELDYISIHFHLSDDVDVYSFYQNFDAYLQTKEKNISTIKGSILGGEFIKGSTLKTLGVDAKPFYKGTENIPEELAKTLQLAIDLIMSANSEDNLEEAFHSVFFSLDIGKSYFPAIAKIRALKILWEKICRGFSQNYIHPEIEIHFSPSAYTEDKYTNMIRATTMAMATVIGGADRLVILPSDARESEGSPFTKRIARNVQHLLKMESFFDKVHDPASGSYYIEKMTGKIVAKSWEHFLHLEKSFR